jgi:hypothetical protein
LNINVSPSRCCNAAAPAAAFAGFPPGPAGEQSVGMLAGPLEFIMRLRRQHGQVVGILLGGERVVLLSEPAAAKQVLVEQADVFVKVRKENGWLAKSSASCRAAA